MSVTSDDLRKVTCQMRSVPAVASAAALPTPPPGDGGALASRTVMSDGDGCRMSYDRAGVSLSIEGRMVDESGTFYCNAAGFCHQIEDLPRTMPFFCVSFHHGIYTGSLLRCTLCMRHIL